MPPGGAGGDGGLHLDGREGGLQCPGRTSEGVMLYAADRESLCHCSVPPAQHEGKILRHPWTGNQMDCDHDASQDEQRGMALPPTGSLLPISYYPGPVIPAPYPCSILAPSQLHPCPILASSLLHPPALSLLHPCLILAPSLPTHCW